MSGLSKLIRSVLAGTSVASIGLLAACSPDPANMEDFISWFSEERGFVRTKAVNYIHYRVQYRPAELMMVGELDPRATYTQSALDDIRDSYGKSIYFMLEISLDPEVTTGTHDVLRLVSEDYADFSGKMKTLAFGLEGCAWLQAGSDRIAPSVYHYERGFELGERQRILFAFPPSTALGGDEVVFVFDDPVFRTGLNRFAFDIGTRRIPSPPVCVE